MCGEAVSCVASGTVGADTVVPLQATLAAQVAPALLCDVPSAASSAAALASVVPGSVAAPGLRSQQQPLVFVPTRSATSATSCLTSQPAALWPLPLPATMRCKECGEAKETRKGFSRRQVKSILAALRSCTPTESSPSLNISVVCISCGQHMKDEENKTPQGVAVDGLSGLPVATKSVQISHNEAWRPPLLLGAASNQQELATASSSSQSTSSSLCSRQEAAAAANSKFASPSLWVTNPQALPIDGLRYYPNFLTEEEERRIMNIIDSHPWSQAVRRRQQFYGEVYYHTTRENAALQPKFEGTDSPENGDASPSSCRVSALPLDEFDFIIDKFYSPLFVGGTVPNNEVFGKGRSNFPSQILVNEYIDTLGIASHFEDEAAFGDVIATISLLQPIYMSLERPREHTNDCDDLIADTKVLLEARSLFVMSSDARFLWRHGITRHLKVHVPRYGREGEFDLVRRDEPTYRRVSLTIRHLKDGRRQVKQPE